jgi:hypothetical protein
MNIIQAMPNNPLRPILVDLDSPGSHITYNTIAKQASLYEGDLAAGSPRMGVPVSSMDLVTLFERVDRKIRQRGQRTPLSTHRIRVNGHSLKTT